MPTLQSAPRRGNAAAQSRNYVTSHGRRQPRSVALGAREVEDDLPVLIRFLFGDDVGVELVGNVGEDRGAAGRDAASPPQGPEKTTLGFIVRVR